MMQFSQIVKKWRDDSQPSANSKTSTNNIETYPPLLEVQPPIIPQSQETKQTEDATGVKLPLKPTKTSIANNNIPDEVLRQISFFYESEYKSLLSKFSESIQQLPETLPVETKKESLEAKVTVVNTISEPTTPILATTISSAKEPIITPEPTIPTPVVNTIPTPIEVAPASTISVPSTPINLKRETPAFNSKPRSEKIPLRETTESHRYYTPNKRPISNNRSQISRESQTAREPLTPKEVPLSSTVKETQIQTKDTQISKPISQITKDTPQINKEISQITKDTPQINKEVSQITKDTPQVNKEVSQIIKNTPQVNKEVSQITKDSPQINKEVSQITKDSPQINTNTIPKTQEIPTQTTTTPSEKSINNGTAALDFWCGISPVPEEIPQVIPDTKTKPALTLPTPKTTANEPSSNNLDAASWDREMRDFTKGLFEETLPIKENPAEPQKMPQTSTRNETSTIKEETSVVKDVKPTVQTPIIDEKIISKDDKPIIKDEKPVIKDERPKPYERYSKHERYPREDRYRNDRQKEERYTPKSERAKEDHIPYIPYTSNISSSPKEEHSSKVKEIPSKESPKPKEETPLTKIEEIQEEVESEEKLISEEPKETWNEETEVTEEDEANWMTMDSLIKTMQNNKPRNSDDFQRNRRRKKIETDRDISSSNKNKNIEKKRYRWF